MSLFSRQALVSNRTSIRSVKLQMKNVFLFSSRFRYPTTCRLAEGLGEIWTPDKLSMGQKHIFLLAIAVVRRRAAQKKGKVAGGILLLDEWNSKLDSETDRLIQDVVKTEFVDYTIIMVSHRLETVRSFCDQIFILEDGQVESGTPNALLATDASWFKRLWNSDT